jgi:hypothetical protein
MSGTPSHGANETRLPGTGAPHADLPLSCAALLHLFLNDHNSASARLFTMEKAYQTALSRGYAEVADDQVF